MLQNKKIKQMYLRGCKYNIKMRKKNYRKYQVIHKNKKTKSSLREN